jgi:hypothetical protein
MRVSGYTCLDFHVLFIVVSTTFFFLNSHTFLQSISGSANMIKQDHKHDQTNVKSTIAAVVRFLLRKVDCRLFIHDHCCTTTETNIDKDNR